MKPNIPLRIAQIIFAVPFVFFGIQHLMNGSNMAGAVPFPPATFWVYFTGAAQVLAGIAFIINFKVKIVSLLLALYVLIIILTIQVPGAIHDFKSNSMMLMKDIGLFGGAILLACLHGFGKSDRTSTEL